MPTHPLSPVPRIVPISTNETYTLARKGKHRKQETWTTATSNIKPTRHFREVEAGHEGGLPLGGQSRWQRKFGDIGNKNVYIEDLGHNAILKQKLIP